MKHFDESEVQEIVLNDTYYPKLLRAIRKPPKALRFRGSLPPNQKIIGISGSRETTQQALQAAFRIGKMLVEQEYTTVTGSPKVATPLLLKARSPQAETLSVLFRVASKYSDLNHEKDWLIKSSLPVGQSFLNVLPSVF